RCARNEIDARNLALFGSLRCVVQQIRAVGTPGDCPAKRVRQESHLTRRPAAYRNDMRILKCALSAAEIRDPAPVGGPHDRAVRKKRRTVELARGEETILL